MLFEELPVKDFNVQVPSQKYSDLWRGKKFKYKWIKYIHLFWIA